MNGEPDITINGVFLTAGQAMALRVALSNFIIDLDDPERLSHLGSSGPLYKKLAQQLALVMKSAPAVTP